MEAWTTPQNLSRFQHAESPNDALGTFHFHLRSHEATAVKPWGSASHGLGTGDGQMLCFLEVRCQG